MVSGIQRLGRVRNFCGGSVDWLCVWGGSKRMEISTGGKKRGEVNYTSGVATVGQAKRWQFKRKWTVSDEAICWTTGVRFPAGAGIFLLRHSVQTGTGSHPLSYPSALISEGKSVWARTDDSPSSSGLRMRGAVPPLPYTSSWCGTWLSTGANFTFTLILYSSIPTILNPEERGTI
jgi:hypothetical protein